MKEYDELKGTQSKKLLELSRKKSAKANTRPVQKIRGHVCWLWNYASSSEQIGQYWKSKTPKTAAVLFPNCAKRLVVLRQLSCAPRQLKPFKEARKHIWNSVNKAAKNAVSQDNPEGSRLKEPHMSPK